MNEINYPIVLAFCGCARSGKTSSADFAQSWFEKSHPDHQVHRMSFAQPLKEGLELMGVYKDRDYELYRNIAQQVGTNMLRKYRDSWWIDLMKENIDGLIPQNNVIIIDDVRFPNEANLVKEYADGYNIFVYGGKDRIDLSLPVYEHPSESMGVFYEKVTRGYDVPSSPDSTPTSMDRIVDSQGSLDKLQQSVYNILNEIFHTHNILKDEK